VGIERDAAHPELIQAGAVVTAVHDRYWSSVRIVRIDVGERVHSQQLSAAEADQARKLANAS